MLQRLQEMFANLELSEKNSFEMANWCQAFKQRNDDYKLVATEHNQQKDAHEFLIGFFNQL